MAKRSYQQYCGIAAALDLLGERWTLLIVRDLLIGPKRFTDLLEGLPGVGTGLLSQRLRELEESGVIEKAALPPPAASTVYRLTPDGEGLRPAMLSLLRWGSRRLGEPDPEQRIDLESLALGFAAHFDPDAAHGVEGDYQLVVDGRPFGLRIANRHIDVRAETVERPRAVITTDTATLMAMNNQALTFGEALEKNQLTVSEEGAEAAWQLMRALAF
ncbi:winged helix-turn-helix transcriptional regulator [Mycolicibacterium confluentis]|nr:helix-turn-helix domain-containing protein [Mycolicibacterium confluentis]MCV7318697.1 helix-turn-helix transcriptional regulator [Mycolicibacterium confluentis]